MNLISPQEAARRISMSKGVIVDVREKDEVAECSIPGALHIPMGELENRMGELPRDKEIYFLCRSGGRSGMACQKAAPHIPHAYSIQGGILAWQKVEKTSGHTSWVPPLMQQVQIVAGVFILMGFFIKPLWFLVPLAGIGLTVAGVTGFCGMAKVLNLMPWNRRQTNLGGTSCRK